MELESSTKEQIEKMIGDNEVFLFMKGNPDFPMCGFSSVASAILKKTGVWVDGEVRNYFLYSRTPATFTAVRENSNLL